MIKEFNDNYSWLSNFSPVDIEFEGIVYPSVEHAYVAAKSNKMDWKLFCTDKHVSPGKIKKLGQQIEIRPDWNDIKVNIMRALIRLKFDKEPYKRLLINTGNTLIQEGNYWGDTFWGVCLKTGKGENKLGTIIMGKRTQLRLLDINY